MRIHDFHEPRIYLQGRRLLSLQVRMTLYFHRFDQRLLVRLK